MEIKLSKTSKMPCNSWSTQALETCNRGKALSKLEGSICSKCYACKGAYKWSPTINRRSENLAQYLSDKKGWVIAMTDKINRSRTKLFRWFDSGDLLDERQFIDILTIAKNCPDTKFWLPTRETKIIKDYLIQGYEYSIPENLNIRISADFIDSDTKDSLYLHSLGLTFSTVESDMKRKSILNLTPCHATIDGSGKCGSCTKCWSKNIAVIAYKLH